MQKFLKISLYLSTLTFLTACNFQSMATKIVPDEVKEQSTVVIDALYTKDVSPFMTMKGDTSDQEFQNQLRSVFNSVSSGEEVSRDLVGGSASASAELGKGKTSNYKASYEIKTQGGYTLVDLQFSKLSNQNKCCVLTNVNVKNSQESPALANLKKMNKVGTIALLGFLGFILLLIKLIISRRKRKKQSV